MNTLTAGTTVADTGELMVAAHLPRDTASRPWSERLPGWAWLAIGVSVFVLSGHRWSVGLLGWVAPVPFLVYLHGRPGLWPRLWLLGALLAAHNLQLLKMITAPVPLAMVPAFAVPLALVVWLVFLAWQRVDRRLGLKAGLCFFPALLTVSEWLLWSMTPMGVWPSIANSQLDNLPLLQITSLVGLGGVTLLLSAVAAWMAGLLLTTDRSAWVRPGLAVASVVLAAHAWGSMRLFAAQDGPAVPMAGVVSDLQLQEALTDPVARNGNTDDMFARSERAAVAGAKVIVWNEGGALVEPVEVPGLLARGARLAKAHGVDLLLAWVATVSKDPFRYENKAVWIGADGRQLQTWNKHHPVPGEPMEAGTEPVEVLQRPWGRVGTAICYDYDFPALGRSHARAGAGVVAVPASDWRGIDPIHAQMARIRAIEGGFSLIRPVRGATSGAYDALGRPRATLSAFEPNERVLLAWLPVTPIWTLYPRIGDLLPGLCLLFSLWMVGRSTQPAAARPGSKV